ncbi:MAG TPA: GDP-mannose 4,6-dehydratase [bacterium]|nr:GDP-mannose 4,6-dehydratase [bacterium]HPI76125.1 GDP-mannose 4,6-dehydratase [bacterium]HPN94942.1 GDP-mannose 4,6-dehydratase [bacterium]
MKALITGITGFAGSHLAELLLARNVEVIGTSRPRSPLTNLSAETLRNIKLIECELRDNVAVRQTLAAVKPDRIFHLAAQSFVPTSWISPADTLTNNIIGQLNIFESLKDLKLDNVKVQLACSSEEYGLVHENELPIKETNPLRPLSPYAVSKVAQDMMGYQYYKSYGTLAFRTRAFNHTGPRRGEIFVTSSFAKQIASIEAGLQPPVISVGNLDARRDFTDVRDTVRAYVDILESGDPGDVYNIATNKTVRIGDMLDILLSMSSVEVKVETDPARLRPSDVPVLLGDYSKLNEKTGWNPSIPFEETMKDLLNYWREKVRP